MILYNNKTYLGGCNRNKRFHLNQYEGYNKSYLNEQERSHCKQYNRTYDYSGQWIIF